MVETPWREQSIADSLQICALERGHDGDHESLFKVRTPQVDLLTTMKFNAPICEPTAVSEALDEFMQDEKLLAVIEEADAMWGIGCWEWEVGIDDGHTTIYAQPRPRPSY